MRTLMGMLMVAVVMISGDDNVIVNVKGFVGEDVLLPCPCLDRDQNEVFKWQTEGEQLIVKHPGNTSDFDDDYKLRTKLFLSEDINNCSLLLKNITVNDTDKYTCIFKSGGQYNRPKVNLTVSERPALLKLQLQNNTTPVPTESPSPDNIWILWLAVPFALVLAAVLSLFLFHKRKPSGETNVSEEERELRISV